MPTTFTKREDNFLRKHYLTMPVKRMANALGRSGYGTSYRMKTLGLIVPPETAQAFKALTQIKPGNIPSNKGKKMSKATRRKVAHTWFRKGHQPHNTRKDGDISIRKDTCGRPYKHIRTALGRWELLHRVIWREKRGPIPHGKIVAFKNGNSLDCRIGNLMLSDRVKIMKQNTIHNLPEPIRNVKMLLGGFNRKLNKYVKDHQ